MGNLFVAVVEELQTALTIFVIPKSFNTTKIKEDPAIKRGHFLWQRYKSISITAIGSKRYLG
jgi:hypothetical protein